MKIKTFMVLFVCHAVPLFIGMGLFPLLPLYVARFGATRTDIGIFYALMYVASAAGMLGTGWLAAHVSRRGLFLIGATLGIPTMALLGHASTLWHVVLLTSLAWFCGGITLSLLHLFTGTLAQPSSRGRVFSLMFLAYPLDALIGGTAVGQLTAAYGYTVMFYALAAIWAIQPIVGLFGLRDPRIMRGPVAPTVGQARPPLGRPFTLLLAASLLSMASVSIGRLGTSLSMHTLGFAPPVVASTAVVSGLVTIPLTLLVGTLSDRFGRRRTLTVSYLLAASGAGTLMVSATVWQFQLAATLLLAAWCINRAVASALATDLLAPEALGRGLPLFGSMDSIASIVGFAASGFVIDTFGGPALYALAAGLALVATVVLAGPPQYQRGQPRTHAGALIMQRNGMIVPAEITKPHLMAANTSDNT